MEHYNAFISYKHAPEDNQVAEAVHKGLERFHIPGKIQKKTGIKKINRIFRDKDELPITSDLSDTIANALADSDYLIVICSTNTKDSAWVPREIEYFLKNHSKRQIFTVLVNGEPVDVIPDILKYDERTVTDENGNEQTVKLPVEPLSCDYRIGVNKAKKTELPRLAAGIIGCAYDELMNRHRAYRLKQLTAVFAAVLAVMIGFCGYMYYSKVQIHKTYMESLKNQSRYLANESGNLLEEEQRITALQLALEALPKDERDDRPVTAEAVRALNNATLAYVGNDGNNINAAWNYQMPNMVSDFELTKDGKIIAILDDGNVVGVWNTENHENMLYLDGVISPVSGIKFIDNESLAVWSDEYLACYDLYSGEEKWNYPLKDDHFDSATEMMVHDDFIVILTYDENFLQFDSKTGKLIKKMDIFRDETKDMGITECRLSPNGKIIAFKVLNGWNSYAYGTYDIASGKVQISDYIERYVKDLEWIDNKTIMLSATDADSSSSMAIGSREIISTDHSDIVCINADDLSERWTADFTCNGVMVKSGFVKVGENVAYYSGNVVTLYDIKTGEEQYSNNVNHSVIDVSDLDKDGEPLYLTENGGYAVPVLNIDDDAVYYNQYFTDELRQVAIFDGVYARRQYAHEVIFYGVHVYDDEWTPLSEKDELPEGIYDSYMDDDMLAVLSDKDDKAWLCIYSLKENGKHTDVKLFGDDAHSYKFLGSLGGRVYLSHEDEQNFELISAGLDDNKAEREPLFNLSTTLDDAATMKDGKLVYTYRDEDYKNILVINNLTNGESVKYDIPDDVGYIKEAPVYYPELNLVVLSGEEIYIADIESGNMKKFELPDGWTEVKLFSEGEITDEFAVSDGRRIAMFGKDGSVKCEINCPGSTPLGMSFIKGQLFVVYNDGSMFIYDGVTGDFVRKVDVSVYYNYSGGAEFSVDDANGLLYIRLEDLMDVVDLESGVEIAYIANCFGHQESRDIFVTRARDEEGVERAGYYKRYSVNELIEKAHKILNGAELSTETKSRYGIE